MFTLQINGLFPGIRIAAFTEDKQAIFSEIACNSSIIKQVPAGPCIFRARGVRYLPYEARLDINSNLTLNVGLTSDPIYNSKFPPAPYEFKSALASYLIDNIDDDVEYNGDSLVLLNSQIEVICEESKFRLYGWPQVYFWSDPTSFNSIVEKIREILASV